MSMAEDRIGRLEELRKKAGSRSLTLEDLDGLSVEELKELARNIGADCRAALAALEGR